jgi:hypothetical protein
MISREIKRKPTWKGSRRQEILLAPVTAVMTEWNRKRIEKKTDMLLTQFQLPGNSCGADSWTPRLQRTGVRARERLNNDLKRYGGVESCLATLVRTWQG